MGTVSTPTATPITAHREWLTERTAWVFGSFCFPYLIVFKLAKLEIATQFVVPTVLVYLITITLNRFRLFGAARLTLIFGTSLSLFFYANLLGEAVGAHLLLFALIPLPLLLFEARNWIGISVGLLAPVSTALVLKWTHFSVLSVQEVVPPDIATWVSSAAILTTFGLIAASVLLYFIANRRYETLLEQQNIDLLKHRALLQESWKDATYAQLMRNIAHEIKNPLFATSMTLSTLEDDLDNPEELKLSVRALEDTISDLMQIVDVMLETGSAFTSATTPHNISEIINRILLLFRTKLTRQKILFTTQFSPDLPEIMADSKALLLVFSNLITNAAEAMPNGGELVITAESKPSDTSGEAGILIGVHDTGHGIEKKLQASIFQQFFTTKSDGLQHGLGLSLVSSLVNQMGGKLWVESDPKKKPGAVFYVWFPTDHHLDKAPV